MSNIHQINNDIVNTQNQIQQAKEYAEQLPALYQHLGRLNEKRETIASQIFGQQKQGEEIKEDGNPDICRSDDTDSELPSHTRGTQQVSTVE